ncbi:MULTISPECIES: VanZ family protein [unclassified Cellulomonas]|uniref:VanZ family protein n=1 Tax=unclassified Cellulomonas TaxID=2620175 RepID=UPI0024B703A3|nr:VanZ family protein [Cellulomonas sp. ES6]WHP17881.1 VanZ family protein [Cellulomonas sp. ES6]
MKAQVVVFHQVPVLPVVVPLAAVVLAALLWSLHRTRRLTAPRAVVALVLCVYVAGVVANTVFPVFTDKPARSGAWGDALALVPFAHYEVADALMNVLVFAPLGVLVALLVPRARWWTALVVSAVFSLGIELTQYVTAGLLGGGHVADVNDLLSNVAGGVLGFLVLAALVRVPAVSALVDRFRWPPVTTGARPSGVAVGA